MILFHLHGAIQPGEEERATIRQGWHFSADELKESARRVHGKLVSVKSED